MSRVLELVQTPVQAALFEQFVVGPDLAHLAVVEHVDPVDVLDGREAVGDGDGGVFFQHTMDDESRRA